MSTLMTSGLHLCFYLMLWFCWLCQPVTCTVHRLLLAAKCETVGMRVSTLSLGPLFSVRKRWIVHCRGEERSHCPCSQLLSISGLCPQKEKNVIDAAIAVMFYLCLELLWGAHIPNSNLTYSNVKIQAEKITSQIQGTSVPLTWLMASFIWMHWWDCHGSAHSCWKESAEEIQAPDKDVTQDPSNPTRDVGLGASQQHAGEIWCFCWCGEASGYPRRCRRIKGWVKGCLFFLPQAQERNHRQKCLYSELQRNKVQAGLKILFNPVKHCHC